MPLPQILRPSWPPVIVEPAGGRSGRRDTMSTKSARTLVGIRHDSQKTRRWPPAKGRTGQSRRPVLSVAGRRRSGGGQLADASVSRSLGSYRGDGGFCEHDVPSAIAALGRAFHALRTVCAFGPICSRPPAESSRRDVVRGQPGRGVIPRHSRCGRQL